MNEHSTRCGAAYELRFRSLFQPGRALAFPCDAHGDVDVAALSGRARANFALARSAVGRDFDTPTIEPCPLH